MPTLTSTSNFVGKYEVHVSEFTIPKLVSYIERMELPILLELFGQELYDLWDNSALPKYTFLTGSFTFQDECGTLWISKGIIDMLTGFIYFDYQRDAYTQQTIGGAQKNQGENSTNASHMMAMLHGRYAEALNTYEAIQAYIKQNPTVYPEFQGITRRPLIPYL